MSQTSATFVATLDQPDQMAAALRSASIDYLSTYSRSATARYHASLAIVPLGAITLQHACDDAHIASGAVAPDCLVLLLPLHGAAGGLVVNAHPVGPHDAMLLGPRAEIRAVCPARQSWAALSVSRVGAFSEWGERPGDGGFAALPGFLKKAPAVARAAAEAGHLARHDPARLSMPAISQALVEQCTFGLGQALQPERAARGRILHQRLRLVAAAQERVDAEIDKPV